jgi:hypothetical protein
MKQSKNFQLAVGSLFQKLRKLATPAKSALRTYNTYNA